MGGKFNCICVSFCSTILGGLTHSICGVQADKGNFNTIAGGYNNRIICGCGNFIGSGQDVVITGACFSSIPSGYFTSITAATYGMHILTGQGYSYAASSTTCAYSIYKNVNNFRIPHPDPSCFGMNLYHTVIEGPTRGDTLYRYNIKTCNCKAEIPLPGYFKYLNECPQVWVTPNDNFGNAYGEIDEDMSKISFCSDTEGCFSAIVIGTRKDKSAMNGWKGVEILQGVEQIIIDKCHSAT